MKYLRFFLLFFALVLAGFSSVAQKNKIVVSGSLTNSKFTKASLFNNGPETAMVAQGNIDTAGKFKLEFVSPFMDLYKLQFEDGAFVFLILEPGDQVALSGDVEDFPNTLKLEGNEQSSQIYESEKVLRSYKTELDNISALYYQGAQNGLSDSVARLLSESYQKKELEQNDYLVSFINAHPASMAVLFVIDRLPIDNFFTTYEVADAALLKKYPENAFVQNFHNKVSIAKKLSIGSMAPEIALPDPEGNIVKLSSMKGKAVVVDFWASWCGPCRRESPNMVKLYNTYKDRGFTIFSVSLDKTKEGWVKAIQDDGLAWTHVSDLKFWQSEAAQNYNVTAVPYTLLLDKEGRIVAKNLRGSDLDKKVAEILSKNQKK